MSKNTLWENKGKISTIKLGFASGTYTDAVTGSYYDGDEGDVLELEVSIDESTLSVYPENVREFREYCEDPSSTSEDSWLYANPEVIESESCFNCDVHISDVEESLLFTMWGFNTGMHLLCSHCSYKLHKDLLEVPLSEIMSRKI